MPIYRNELVRTGTPLTPEQSDMIDKLLRVMNIIRKEYGRPMIVTSGFRTIEDQKRIDAKRIVGGKPAGPRLGSAHLKGAACDIWDRDGDLWRWCLDNEQLLRVELKVHLEDKSRTPTWVHFQITPPKSGNWIFQP